MPKICPDETGKKYGRLTVLCKAARRFSKVKRNTMYFCVCECGKETIITYTSFNMGCTRSCGCLKKELASSHGLCKHKLYKVWSSIKDRCNNTKTPDFEHYGDRGIEICKEWNDDFYKFYTWCIENGYKESLEIDRVNNDGNYDPSNCRFVTHYENMHNRRDLLKTNSSGYVGVFLTKDTGRYRTHIKSKLLNNGKTNNLGTFKTPQEAVKARNEFIKKHNLPHKIQEI